MRGIEVTIQTEYAHIPSDFTGDICGLVSLVATQRLDDDHKRAPCDLSLVIDKSGSMSGAKLRLVVQACKFVLAQLNKEDRLGLILYDSFVSEVFPLTFLDAAAKNRLTSILDDVHSGSATNLSGGLLKGLQQQCEKHFPWIFDTDEPRVVDLAIGHCVSEENKTTLYVKLEAGEDVVEKVKFELIQSAKRKSTLPPNMVFANQMPVMQMNTEEMQGFEEEFEIVQMPNEMPEEVQQVQMQQQVQVQQQVQMPSPRSDVLTCAPFETLAFADACEGSVFKITVTFKDGSKQTYEHKLSGNGSQTTQCIRFFKPSETSRDAARSVFLLTDGIANHGITSTSGIVGAAKGAIAHINSTCTVNCFGFGDDHSSDMLSELANACGGDYLYIENEDSISTAFAHALGGLLSVVAQNIVVHVDCTCVSKYPDFKRDGGKIDLGDMFSEERRDLVFHFSLSANIINFGSVRVSYFNIVTNSWETSEDIPLTIERADALSVVNPALAFHRARVRVVETLQRAKEHGDHGRIDEARECIKQELCLLEEANDEGVSSLMPRLVDMQRDMVDHRSFLSKGNKKLTANMRENAKQRAMGGESIFTNQCQDSMKMESMSFFK